MPVPADYCPGRSRSGAQALSAAGRTKLRRRLLPLGPLLAAVVAACGGDSVEPPVPARVSVTPASVEARTSGETFQFSARVLDSQGNAMPDAQVTWSSDDEAVATVSSSGLATVVGQGRAQVRATAASASGRATVIAALEPAELLKVSGDYQTVPGLTRTPEDPVVRVTDAAGLPLSDVRVEFDAFADRASVSPTVVRTDDAGEARTAWTIGLESRQYLRATVQNTSLYVDFAVDATEPPLTVWTIRIPDSRATVPYHVVLEEVGGTPPFAWSLAGGALPAGMSLDSAGALSGQSASEGSSEFTVAVRDAQGTEATGTLTLHACPAPLALEAGQVEVFDALPPAVRCAPFLPAGSSGDRYHVSAVRTTTNSGHVEFVLEVSEPWPGADPAAAGTRRTPAEPPHYQLHPVIPGFDPEADRRRARMKHDLLARTQRIVSALDPAALLPNAGGSPRAQRRAAATNPPAQTAALRPTTWESGPCSSNPPERVTANLVGYNDWLAIYQDSAQQATAPVRPATATQVLDFYADYGASTIEEYFGGVTDINSDGRVVLFVTPVVPNNYAAYVWGPDFFAASACPGSNEMEIVYYNQQMFDYVTRPVGRRSYQVMATTVHEVKHIASLYRRASSRNWPPSWLEEGTAEIAGEVASRRAVEATGGVARTAVFDRSAYPPRSGEVTTPENSGTLLRLVRTALSYSQARNSLVENPTDDHTFYGTSWHFHRFLADAYADAAALGDSAFFRKLNTDLPVGVAGIEQITGKPMADLLREYAIAMTLNGTGAPQPERAFTTYNFRSAIRDLFRPTWEDRPRGFYPWPKTGTEVGAFEPARFPEYLHPGGILFHEFQSDGRGEGITIAGRAGYGSRVSVVVARVR